MKLRYKIIVFAVFTLHTLLSSQNPVDNSSIVGKVVCGYQGWFMCYGDGSPVASWRHWANGQYQSNTPNPSPGFVSFETYPDVSAYGQGQLFQTGLGNLGDGNPSKLFSSYKNEVVDQHFSWMEQNGIDGVALQRFIGETADGVFKTLRDSMSLRVKRAAEKHHRIFYLMYDMSGTSGAQLDFLKSDWTNTMTGQLHITNSAAYAHQNGKPVVCLWGLGFTHIDWNATQSLELINWFKNQGYFVIGGTPTHWRNGVGDSKAGFENVYKAYDMISPWSVGRFNSIASADVFLTDLIQPDFAYCNANDIEYQPVAFPGFAWSNWNGGPRNEIPREKGDFFWRQAFNIRQQNIASLYLAMFDEYDESTAFAPLADSYLGVPTDQYFLTSSADGTFVSSDFYLRLAGRATQMIKGQIPADAAHNVPLSNGPIWFRTSFEDGYDALPNWSSTVDPSSAVVNMAGTGPGGIPRCTTSTLRAHAGGASLRLNGQDNSSANSSAYFKVFDVNIPVNANTWLKFWSFPENDRSRFVSLDLIMTDGTTLRDAGATDVNGSSMHPNAGRGTVNQWNENKCQIGNWLSGKTIDRVVMAYDHGPETGSVSAYIDDISIYTGSAASQTGEVAFEKPLSIYPTLVGDQLMVDLTEATNDQASLVICNVLGQVLLQAEIKGGQKNLISVAHLPKGVCWATVIAPGFRYSTTLVKE